MSDAAAAARAELAARQRSWMQQRQAEQDRIQAETSIRRERIANPVPVAPQNNDSSTGAAAVAGMDTEVLDRLTMQIADRLQVEVRKESAKLMQDGAVGAQVESLLERHIGSNTCPVCFELMAGKERQPMLLFPCGHTFCAACLRMHLEKLDRKTCPYCREKVSSQAPNISLQQVIDGFVERQTALRKGEVLPELEQGLAAQQNQQKQRMQMAAAGGGGGFHVNGGLGGADPEATKYAEQYRAYSMRCKVMRNQLLESRGECAELFEKRRTAEAVLEHLGREEVLAEERLEAARLELEVVRSQRAEQAGKCDTLNGRQRELEQMEELVGQTHHGLEGERQKALLLLRNFDPGMAEELRIEFEDD